MNKPIFTKKKKKRQKSTTLSPKKLHFLLRYTIGWFLSSGTLENHLDAYGYRARTYCYRQKRTDRQTWDIHMVGQTEKTKQNKINILNNSFLKIFFRKWMTISLGMDLKHDSSLFVFYAKLLFFTMSYIFLSICNKSWNKVKNTLNINQTNHS